MNDLLTLPLARLEQPLKIHSRILEADLWLVPPRCADRRFDAPVYTPDECRLLLLLGLSANELKAAHLAKTLFEGDLILSADLDSLRRLYQALLQKFRDWDERYSARPTEVDETELLQLARHLSRLLNHADTLENATDLS